MTTFDQFLSSLHKALDISRTLGGESRSEAESISELQDLLTSCITRLGDLETDLHHKVEVIAQLETGHQKIVDRCSECGRVQLLRVISQEHSLCPSCWSLYLWSLGQPQGRRTQR